MTEQQVPILTTPTQPILPELPPTPRDFASPSLSELLPFTSKKINILKSGMLVPATVTALTCTLLFFTSKYTSMYTVIGTYILFITFYACYAYSGLRTNILIYIFPCAIVYFEFVTPIFRVLAILFREILPGGNVPEDSSFTIQFISMFFGAGLLEELVKGVPALIGLFVALTMAKGRSGAFGLLRWIKVTSPLDGMLMGLAAGASFIFIETLFQYVPNAYNGTDGYAGGFALLIPRMLQGFTGHMGWAAISGYFIGMAARYPRSIAKLLAVGWLVPAVLHGFWNSASLLGTWATWVSTALSLFLFIGCFLKAKQLEAMRDGHVFVASDSILAGTAPLPVAASTIPEAHATNWGGLAYVFGAFAQRAASTAATASSAASVSVAASNVAPESLSPAKSINAPVAAAVPVEIPRFTLASGAARFGILAGQTIDLSILFPGTGMPAGSLAEVTVNPLDQTMMGLKNMTGSAWSASTPEGTTVSVSPGKNIKLVANGKITVAAVDILVQKV